MTALLAGAVTVGLITLIIACIASSITGPQLMSNIFDYEFEELPLVIRQRHPAALTNGCAEITLHPRRRLGDR